MLVQKFPRQQIPRQILLSCCADFLPDLPNQTFQKFYSTAVGLLSSRNNFVCKDKEIRNLPKTILESDLQTQKKKYLKERIPPVTQKQQLPTKQEAFVLYTFCSTSQTFFLPSANKQTFALYIYCLNLLLS